MNEWFARFGKMHGDLNVYKLIFMNRKTNIANLEKYVCQNAVAIAISSS